MRKGAGQDCTLSPWLFNVFIDKVAREAKQHFTSGVKLSTGELEVLLFGDDMVIFSDSAERLESNLKAMSEVLSRWELKVNWKTKVTRVVRQKGHSEVRVGDMEIEQVDEMMYLGVMIRSDRNMEKEVEVRIGSAVRMIGGISETVLQRNELSEKPN